MDFKVVHRLLGRIRVKYKKELLNVRQASLIKMLIEMQNGIENITVNHITGSILINYKNISEETCLSFIKAMDESFYNDEELLSSAIVPKADDSLLGTLLFMVAGYTVRRFLPISLKRVVGILRVAPRILKGIKSILSGHPFNSTTLDAAALTAAIAIGDFNTAATVSLLLDMGDVMEDYTKRKSFDNLAETLLYSNEKVHIIKDDEEIIVPSKTLKIGDILIARLGSVIAADGVVIQGEAMVNQASMTGEPLPVMRSVGMSVFAGTTVEEGELAIQVKASGEETRVSKIIKMIDHSQSYKASIQVRSEQTADKIVPFNFLLAVLVWLFTGNKYKAATTLMVDYSCAMKLAAPIAVLSAMRDAASHGVLIKGGKFLETLAEADTLIFDKTGTLTESAPTVYKVVPIGNHSEEEVLKLSACLEEHFPHSLAKAVVREAEKRNVKHREEHTKVEYIVAHGIASSIEGEKLLIGSYHFIFTDEKIALTSEAKKIINEMEKSGHSLLYFAKAGELAGIIAIEDPLRKEAKEVLQELRNTGIQHIAMITGDGEQTAKTIASEVGADIYNSQALPDDKVAYIKKLKAKGHTVVMVGDGINDSPALSEADVGIAMGKSSSIVSETADIILNNNGLESLPIIRKTGINLLKKIETNNNRIIQINSVLLITSLAGFLTPAVAALLHNSTTIAICISAMRSNEKNQK